MTERPLLVPTSLGPAGVIVGEPPNEPVGAAIVLQGVGSPRAGFARLWAVTARALVDRGLVVLRVDYPGLGDSSGAGGGLGAHGPFLREVVTWFREEGGASRIGAVASCYGARLALGLAAEGVLDAGLLLVTPWMGLGRRRQGMRDVSRRVRRRLGLPSPVDPGAMADLRTASSAVPVRVLVGEEDSVERATLRAVSRRLAVPLPMDVEPGVRLHPSPTPSARAAITAWVVDHSDHLLIAEPVRA